MLLYIAIAIAVIVAALLVRAAVQPPSFRIARTQEVSASPDKIYNALTDFQQWRRWSPYEKKDPGMKRLYSGAAAGKGAVYAWDGDKNVGQGSMEIVESSPQKVVIKLDFLKPFEAHNTGEFILQPKGDVTDVTWAIHGPSPFMSKVIGTFIDFDHMIGKDFEQGLADLKVSAEK